MKETSRNTFGWKDPDLENSHYDKNDRNPMQEEIGPLIDNRKPTDAANEEYDLFNAEVSGEDEDDN